MDDEIADASAVPHPDCILRLASAVHRFSIPCINTEDQLSFEDSFKTCSANHPSTLSVLRAADVSRQEIKKNMADAKLSHEALSKALREYMPSINQILLSCKFQPGAAMLDKRLVFSWYSGIERTPKKKRNFDSEALMFELVITLAAYGLSESNMGCDACVEGDFPQASRQFAKTAGVFQYLGEDLLPNWMANSKQHAEMEKESLAETRVGVCVALTSLYMAMAQQMAVSTILVKPGVPNYALVGKLCLGVAEDLESFVSTMRSKSPTHMSRMDPNFMTLITFLINAQQATSLYFLARSLWTASDYGVAIAALSEATVAMRQRSSPTGRGIPEITPNGPLRLLVTDINAFRIHMGSLLKSWEKDNSLVYFDKVPPSVPANKALKAIQLKKVVEFTLEMRDPLPLGDIHGPWDDNTAANSNSTVTSSIEGLTAASVGNDAPPSYGEAMANPSFVEGRERSDSEYARELQEKLNMQN